MLTNEYKDWAYLYSEVKVNKADNKSISVRKILNFESIFSDFGSNFSYLEQLFKQLFGVLEQSLDIF